MLWLITLPLLIGLAKPCTVVGGDRILGSDLARGNPIYAALPPDLVAGLTPIAGMQRVLDSRRLAMLARQHGIAGETFAPLCFERPTEVLSEARLRPELERALGPETRLEIVDFSRNRIPIGELSFRASDLSRPSLTNPDQAVTWRGRVKDASGSTAAVWARIRVTKYEQWIEVAAPIHAHELIGESLIVAKSGWRFPLPAAPVRDLGAVLGKQTVRSLSPGQIIVPGMLVPPKEVERGETVDVEVVSGAVSLRFAALAETSGRCGDAVVVRAADSGKRWRARVQGQGKVRIDADHRKLEVAAAMRGDAGAAGSSSGREGEESGGSRSGIASGPLSR